MSLSKDMSRKDCSSCNFGFDKELIYFKTVDEFFLASLFKSFGVY